MLSTVFVILVAILTLPFESKTDQKLFFSTHLLILIWNLDIIIVFTIKTFIRFIIYL